MFDYVVSLREGIMDAWGGIIGAMKAGEKSMLLSFLVKVHLLTC
jgi:importin subunit beta-1